MTTVLAFLKRHWLTIVLVLALVAAIVVGYAWVKHQQAGFTDSIVELNTAHREEIEKINQARLLEQQEHAAQLQKLQDSIAKIESDYADAKARIKTEEKQQRKDIVVKYGNDADGLAGLLSDRFGFVVVKP